MSLTVGVIGGMGPAATTQFIVRVQALTPAKRDQDHLRLIVDCNPNVPDRNAVSAGGESPAQVLGGMAAGLERAGAQILAMPCNAAHAYAPDIEAAVSIPFINLIEAVCDATLADGATTVGVMAADACLEAGLYQDAFARRGVNVLLNSEAERAEFMTLLYRIKAGDTGAAVRSRMRQMAQALVAQGAQAIVAGCTEIPLVLAADDLDVPFADSIEVLARRTIAQASGVG
jgi:aspartate racemase